MLLALTWTGLAIGGLVLHALLTVRIWRRGRSAVAELTAASRRFSETAALTRESFAVRHPAPEPAPDPLGDPVALRRARDRRLRIARSRRERRLRAVQTTPRAVRVLRPPVRDAIVPDTPAG